MATYVFTYRSPKGYVPSAETGAEWFAWFDGMGDALVNLGHRVDRQSSLGICDSDTTELGGYSIITAPSLDAALAIAKGCPHLKRGEGGVEVGELDETPREVRLNAV
jgi:hypothetical protein